MQAVAAYFRRIIDNVTIGRKAANPSREKKKKKREATVDSGVDLNGEGEGESDAAELESGEEEFPEVFDEEPPARNNDIDSRQRGEHLKMYRPLDCETRCWSDDGRGIVIRVPTCRKVSIVSTAPSDGDAPLEWSVEARRKQSVMSDSAFTDALSGAGSRKLSLVSIVSDSELLFEDALSDQTMTPSEQGARISDSPGTFSLPVNDVTVFDPPEERETAMSVEHWKRLNKDMNHPDDSVIEKNSETGVKDIKDTDTQGRVLLFDETDASNTSKSLTTKETKSNVPTKSTVPAKSIVPAKPMVPTMSTEPTLSTTSNQRKQHEKSSKNNLQISCGQSSPSSSEFQISCEQVSPVTTETLNNTTFIHENRSDLSCQTSQGKCVLNDELIRHVVSSKQNEIHEKEGTYPDNGIHNSAPNSKKPEVEETQAKIMSNNSFQIMLPADSAVVREDTERNVFSGALHEKTTNQTECDDSICVKRDQTDKGDNNIPGKCDETGHVQHSVQPPETPSKHSRDLSSETKDHLDKQTVSRTETYDENSPMQLTDSPDSADDGNVSNTNCSELQEEKKECEYKNSESGATYVSSGSKCVITESGTTYVTSGRKCVISETNKGDRNNSISEVNKLAPASESECFNIEKLHQAQRPLDAEKKTSDIKSGAQDNEMLRNDSQPDRIKYVADTACLEAESNSTSCIRLESDNKRLGLGDLGLKPGSRPLFTDGISCSNQFNSVSVDFMTHLPRLDSTSPFPLTKNSHSPEEPTHGPTDMLQSHSEKTTQKSPADITHTPSTQCCQPAPSETKDVDGQSTRAYSTEQKQLTDCVLVKSATSRSQDSPPHSLYSVTTARVDTSQQDTTGESVISSLKHREGDADEVQHTNVPSPQSENSGDNTQLLDETDSAKTGSKNDRSDPILESPSEIWNVADATQAVDIAGNDSDTFSETTARVTGELPSPQRKDRNQRSLDKTTESEQSSFNLDAAPDRKGDFHYLESVECIESAVRRKDSFRDVTALEALQIEPAAGHVIRDNLEGTTSTSSVWSPLESPDVNAQLTIEIPIDEYMEKTESGGETITTSDSITVSTDFAYTRIAGKSTKSPTSDISKSVLDNPARLLKVFGNNVEMFKPRGHNSTSPGDEPYEHYYTLAIPSSVDDDDAMENEDFYNNDIDNTREEDDDLLVDGVGMSDDTESDNEDNESDIVFANITSYKSELLENRCPTSPPGGDVTCYFDDQQEDDDDTSSYDSSDEDDGEDSSDEEFVNVMKNSRLKVLPVIYEDDGEHRHLEISEPEEDIEFEDALDFSSARVTINPQLFSEYLLNRANARECHDANYSRHLPKNKRAKKSESHYDKLCQECNKGAIDAANGSVGRRETGVDSTVQQLLFLLSRLGASRGVFDYYKRFSPRALREVIKVKFMHLGLHPGKNLTPEAGRILVRSALFQAVFVLEQLYDMGTGKNYTPSSSYGASSRAYTPSSSRPSYARTSSYDPPKYRSANVSDTIKKFGVTDPKYSPSSYGADRYQSTADKYPSLDRYSNRSGYTSDYGAGSPYGSWDRASTRSSNSRYGGGSREASPVSTRSSRYDYSSSASGPYSTYSSYKSGSDASPVPKTPARPYERQSSRGYETAGNDSKTTPVGGGGATTGAGKVPGLPVGRQEASSKRGRRGVSVSSESDDSAPEAEKRDQAVRYLICRGTSPIPEGEPKEAKVKDRASISRTRRIRVPEKVPAKLDKLSGKKANTDKGTVDCAIQTNLDQPQARRQRTSSNSSFAPVGGSGGGGGGSGQPGETFYKYRDKVLGGPAPGHGYSKGSGPTTPSYTKPAPPTPISRNSSRSTLKDEPRRSYAEEGVSTPPNERSWRQSVYGEPAPRGGSRREEEMGDEEDDTDDRSSRHGRRRKEGPRTSTPSTLRERDVDLGSAAEDKRSSRKSKTSRSSSREDMLDDRPRRKRHSSKELLEEPEVGEKAPLTPEILSLRDSIEKVHQWKQNLQPPEVLSPEGRQQKRHPGAVAGAEIRGEVYEEHPREGRARASRQYSNRDESPPNSRDNSPSRRSRHRPSRNASRQNSHDSILDDDEDDRDPRLPNKDFRKSELNKAEHYYEDPESFNREMSPGEARRRQRRSDGHDHAAGQKMKKSGSSSEAFSKEDSPSRHRHSGLQRQAPDDHKRLIRDSSRDSLLDDRRRSRREQHDNEISDGNGSQFGFNREESPNHRNSKHVRGSRQNSREDVLDERGQNSARQRPSQLGVGSEQGRVPQSASQQSLPDIVPSPGSEWGDQQQKPKRQYKRQKSGMIGEDDDIDTILNGNRKFSRGGQNIMDEPVPHTSHYPLKPAPASPLSPGHEGDRRARPNSYAFEKDKRQAGNCMKQSKSHGDKLIDIEDEATESQRVSGVSAPPTSGMASKQPRGPRQASATAKQMWGILQAKKGLVTITDFVSLCEKPPPQRKLITVPGADENDFTGYKNADELLENMGVDVRKVGAKLI